MKKIVLLSMAIFYNNTILSMTSSKLSLVDKLSIKLQMPNIEDLITNPNIKDDKSIRNLLIESLTEIYSNKEFRAKNSVRDINIKFKKLIKAINSPEIELQFQGLDVFEMADLPKMAKALAYSNLGLQESTSQEISDTSNQYLLLAENLLNSKISSDNWSAAAKFIVRVSNKPEYWKNDFTVLSGFKLTEDEFSVLSKTSKDLTKNITGVLEWLKNRANRNLTKNLIEAFNGVKSVKSGSVNDKTFRNLMILASRNKLNGLKEEQLKSLVESVDSLVSNLSDNQVTKLMNFLLQDKIQTSGVVLKILKYIENNRGSVNDIITKLNEYGAKQLQTVVGDELYETETLGEFSFPRPKTHSDVEFPKPIQEPISKLKNKSTDQFTEEPF
jgi:hypothetical protein